MENTQLPTFVDTEVVLMEDDLEVKDSESTQDQDELETDDSEQDDFQDDQDNTNQNDDQVDPEKDPLAIATFEALVDKGVFENDENFDGRFETIDEKLEALPAKFLEQAISSLPEHSQSVLKYIKTAGENLTPDELKNFMREYLGELDVPDVSSADSARAYLEDHLKAQGLRPAAIQAQLDDLEDSDELISEAEKLLKAKEKKTETLIQDKEQENRQIIENQKQFYQAVTTALEETKWSKPQQEKVLKTIPKANTIFEQVISKPKAYIQLIDFLEKFNGDEFNLEPYRKQGEGRATSVLKEKIEKSGFSSASTTKASKDTPQKDGFQNYKIIV